MRAPRPRPSPRSIVFGVQIALLIGLFAMAFTIEESLRVTLYQKAEGATSTVGRVPVDLPSSDLSEALLPGDREVTSRSARVRPTKFAEVGPSQRDFEDEASREQRETGGPKGGNASTKGDPSDPKGDQVETGSDPVQVGASIGGVSDPGGGGGQPTPSPTPTPTPTPSPTPDLNDEDDDDDDGADDGDDDKDDEDDEDGHDGEGRDKHPDGDNDGDED